MSVINSTLLWHPDELARGIDRLLGVEATATGDARLICRSTPMEEAVASALFARNLESTPLSCSADEIARCIAGSAPMVLSTGAADKAVLVARANSRTATLIGQDGNPHAVPMTRLVAELEVPLSADLETSISRLERDVSHALAVAFRREQQKHRRVFVGWQLPVERAQALWNRANAARVAGLISVHSVHFGLWVLSWITLVAALLSVGDRDALLAVWMVSLLSSLVLLPIESLLQQNLATRLGIAIKQGLLKKALVLDKAAVREQGIGQLTARALEANRLDALAAQGGLRVLLSTFDAIAIVTIFIWYAGLHPLLLLFFLVALLAVRWWTLFHQAEERLHAAHLRLTSVHTEEMIGHRTRKAFLGQSQWHTQEESCLAAYERACTEADRAELGIGVIPRLWAVCGVAVVLLELFSRNASTLTSVALIGFVIIGFGILHGASTGVMKLLKALVSSRYVIDQQQDQSATSRQTRLSPDPDSGSHLIVEGLEYGYPDSSRRVLGDVNLELNGTDKVLLTGSSGSGKSTLGALLAGRLQPTSGTVLSQGVDRYLVGTEGWLKQVCYVPQPGSNHVLTDTFAFNLLLGRSWPPTAGDLQEAREVAEHLGLGALLEKMPAGMMQMVGEGGWRLSQGEQARLFLARGILQGARVLVADELLAPLDPVTGLQVLKTLEALPSQLVLIAHT